MTDMNGAHGHSRDLPAGRWVSEGGRMRWVPARERAMENEERADSLDMSGVDLDALDEATWASDNPPLPAGASERDKARAVLAWLSRQIAEGRERVALATLELREQRLHRDEQAGPRRRRGPTAPDPLEFEIAHEESAVEWLESAREVLSDEADRNPPRALLEWYLWILSAGTPIEQQGDDPLATARIAGEREAWDRARQHAEHLAARDSEDD